MIHILVKLPVTTPGELTSFENAVRGATEGYAITRSLAYTKFRIGVLRYHQIGFPESFRNILTQHHFIETTGAISTLFRTVQDTGVPDPEHDTTPIDNYDDTDNPNKRIKYMENI
jgi:hypothetical protein